MLEVWCQKRKQPGIPHERMDAFCLFLTALPPRRKHANPKQVPKESTTIGHFCEAKQAVHFPARTCSTQKGFRRGALPLATSPCADVPPSQGSHRPSLFCTARPKVVSEVSGRWVGR